MTDPFHGAMISPPSPRASDDDVAETISQMEYAAECMEGAISALNGAHLQCETALGYSGIAGALFDLPGLRAAHKALLERLELLQRRGR